MKHSLDLKLTRVVVEKTSAQMMSTYQITALPDHDTAIYSQPHLRLAMAEPCYATCMSALECTKTLTSTNRAAYGPGMHPHLQSCWGNPARAGPGRIFAFGPGQPLPEGLRYPDLACVWIMGTRSNRDVDSR